MKLRDGFVSNSSSTSFFVAFVPEADNLNIKTFEFLLSKMDGDKVDLHKQDVKSARDTIQQDLTNYIAARDWLSGYLHILRNCMANREATVLLNEFKGYMSTRPMIEVRDRYKLGMKEVYDGTIIADHVERYEHELRMLDMEIVGCEEMLSKLAPLPDDMMVCKWKEDNWTSGLFGDLVTMLVKDGRIVVLERGMD
jgi:hypothetical protein